MKNLIPIEHRSQRVLTTKQLAEFYETDSVRIQQNYIRNIERYIPGIHCFPLEGDDLKLFKTNYQFDSLQNVNSLMLWTEKGALLHAKSLNTDKAWEVYQELVDTYFRVKESNPYLGLSKEIQAIFIQDKKIQEVENRVEKLENTMTIDYSQQEILRELVNKKVVDVLGGKASRAYKIIRSKAFSEFWRYYKRTMQVNSYRNTPTVDFDTAKSVVGSWEPDQELRLMIVGANVQVLQTV